MFWLCRHCKSLLGPETILWELLVYCILLYFLPSQLFIMYKTSMMNTHIPLPKLIPSFDIIAHTRASRFLPAVSPPYRYIYFFLSKNLKVVDSIHILRKRTISYPTNLRSSPRCFPHLSLKCLCFFLLKCNYLVVTISLSWTVPSSFKNCLWHYFFLRVQDIYLEFIWLFTDDGDDVI